jgi:hypothetical protein
MARTVGLTVKVTAVRSSRSAMLRRPHRPASASSAHASVSTRFNRAFASVARGASASLSRAATDGAVAKRGDADHAGTRTEVEHAAAAPSADCDRAVARGPDRCPSTAQ